VEAAKEIAKCLQVGKAQADLLLDEEMKESKDALYAPRSCYTCKRRFHEMHSFYDQLCPMCAELNWRKRNQVADLQGRIGLLTGGRVKIGFECGLRLLRCGAQLVLTTRFPHDCARRYAREKDFEQWKDRLHIYGLDLRDLASVKSFCSSLLATYSHLDFIVNNAAQTVRRPPAYYKHLMKTELVNTVELEPELQQLVRGDAHSLHLLQKQGYNRNEAKISFIAPSDIETERSEEKNVKSEVRPDPEAERESSSSSANASTLSSSANASTLTVDPLSSSSGALSFIANHLFACVLAVFENDIYKSCMQV
jgi:hypothetical protein